MDHLPSASLPCASRIVGWALYALASLGLLYFVIREGREVLEEARGHEAITEILPL
jgi:hypothetical protein